MAAKDQPDEGILILPKRLTLATLWTVIVLGVGGVSTGTMISARVAQLEAKDSSGNLRWERADRERDGVIRLYEKVDAIGAIVKRIEDKLDRR